MPTEVAPNVIQQRLAHAKIIYFEDAGLLVDTGPDSEWTTLETFLDDRGGVETVFLTHSHGDHVGNVDRVVNTYEPNVLYPKNEPLDDLPLSETDVTTVADGEEIIDGVRVIEVPGHTPGICALNLFEHETLLASDVIDGSDRRGLPQGYLLPPPSRYNWDSEQAETNLERLLDLDFDTAVVTHGTNVEEEAKLKLDRYLNFPNHYRKDLLGG